MSSWRTTFQFHLFLRSSFLPVSLNHRCLSLQHLDPNCNILNSPAGAEYVNLSNAVIAYLGYLDLTVNATQASSIDDFGRCSTDSGHSRIQ
ncbi:hypothetical protein HYPSUDRAFT_35523 [Hypholoma sublateritium FD-334 SS-4]|uniref:Uncharacterized protein n=1 Tax=Hypholoma sublateritium (strain FD-334 SS-4) TaxID=945553 RepID=A0A0D2LHA4_HYPSF|nr:hypothetical protein HYPSUDRAFT_35523 [Hypholoma sublateritium FD-334 SS-4]